MTPAQLEYQSFLRQDIRDMINTHCRKTGAEHSLVFRTCYLQLEMQHKFRVPSKDGLRAVFEAGLVEKLHGIVKKQVKAD